MKKVLKSLLNFSVSTNFVIPTQCLRSQSICRRQKQLVVTKQKPLSHDSFLDTLRGSTTGAPILVTMPTVEEEIKVTSSDGYQVDAYFVTSEENARSDGRGVILMADILGFKNDDTRSVGKRLAGAGLPTIVPDLFRGEPWVNGRTMAEYETWRAQHDSGRVREDLKSARDFLVGKGNVTRLGLVGFCYGGGRLMEEIAMASRGLNPKVAVAFYPTRFDPESVARSATCSLLFISGDEDELVPMNVIQRLQKASEESSAMEDCEIHIVKGAGHAFAHHPRTEQDKIDGELALDEAVRYLTSKL